MQVLIGSRILSFLDLSRIPLGCWFLSNVGPVTRTRLIQMNQLLSIGATFIICPTVTLLDLLDQGALSLTIPWDTLGALALKRTQQSATTTNNERCPEAHEAR